MDVARICRLCGQNNNKSTYNIFEKNEVGQQIVQLIKQHLPVLVYRTDPLSKQICGECYTHLNVYSRFFNKCMNEQENLRYKLLSRSNDNGIKLYLDALGDHLQFDIRTQPTSPNKRPVTRNYACQVSSSETINQPTERTFRERNLIKNFRILTPDVINGINNDSNFMVTATSQDGIMTKKRKLAGPKSKIRHNLPINPPSLLQCALLRINRSLYSDFNDASDNDMNFENQHEDSVSDEDINEVESLIVHSSSSNGMKNSNSDTFHPSFPVLCNYCLKGFANSVDLAKHEVQHIQVDLGPKIENQEFMIKHKNYYKLYMNWCKRIEEGETVQATIEETNLEYDESIEKEPESLLVAESTSENNLFEVINNEVTVNGIPLKDYDKTQRRTLYKSIVVDGIKRKFCTVCHHTFKDNWAIDIHYLNSSCQYTCKYCGLKFKFHKELYPNHLKLHEGESCNKIFGPTDRKTKYKKRRILKMNRYIPSPLSAARVPPKVKPIKMKHLLKKKGKPNSIKIKKEPGTSYEENVSDVVTLEKMGNMQPYQAYFCRKCFKVFFKIDEFNIHTSICGKDGSNSEKDVDKIAPVSTVNLEINTEPVNNVSTISKRPVRSCVKDFSTLHDSDNESVAEDYFPKITQKKETMKTPDSGFECGVCCSSFPSVHSRNSHMRIHKGQKNPADINPKINNIIVQKTSTVLKSENIHFKITEAKEESNINNIRLANLNPTVARLVQNNPHLTIRSYIKPMNIPKNLSELSAESESFMKRAYRCSDCNGRFENKSLLYYHKQRNCVVKRNYECAFCRKKFGSHEQYNSHMLHVHPE